MQKSPRRKRGKGSSVQLGGEHMVHTTEVPAPQLFALATPRGLVLRGPGGTIYLSNKTLAAVAEFAIALQDLIHTDPDLEHDPLNEGEPAFDKADVDLCRSYDAGPGCPLADCGEENGDREGIDEREPDYAPCLPVPRYGVDQTKGPLNESEFQRAYYESQRG
jgi:hypothetical protein